MTAGTVKRKWPGTPGHHRDVGRSVGGSWRGALAVAVKVGASSIQRTGYGIAGIASGCPGCRKIRMEVHVNDAIGMLGTAGRSVIVCTGTYESRPGIMALVAATGAAILCRIVAHPAGMCSGIEL